MLRLRPLGHLSLPKLYYDLIRNSIEYLLVPGCLAYLIFYILILLMDSLLYDLELERALLARLLLDQNIVDSILSQVNSRVFYFEDHQALYSLFEDLYLKGKPLTYEATNSLIGSQASSLTSTTLIEITNSNPSTDEIDKIVVKLTELYFRRQLVKAGNDLIKLGRAQGLTLDQLFDQVTLTIDTIETDKPTVETTLASDVLLEAFVDLEVRSKLGALSGLATGFSDLDLVTQGFQRSDLIIVAGRPSMGKTSLALNFARNIADLHSIPVVIFSLEMSRQQIIYRFLSMESQVPASRLRTGHLTTSEWVSIKWAVSSLAKLDIYLDDNFSPSIGAISTCLQTIKRKKPKLGLVVIDYLQLLGSSSSTLSRVQELSKITRELKQVARTFETPFLVLSQLSRGVELRPNKRPLLADLRESGCIPSVTNLYIQQQNKEVVLSSQLAQLPTCLTLQTLVAKNSQLRLEDAILKRIFPTGKKAIWKLGSLHPRDISLTKNHKVLTHLGWKEVQELTLSSTLSVLDIFNFPRSWGSIPYSKTYRREACNLSFVILIDGNETSKVRVYDLWVPQTNSFISNSYVLHNSIEQDADLVLMLYREAYYEEVESEADANITEIIISKHRNGPIGTVYSLFNPTISSFTSLLT